MKLFKTYSEKEVKRVMPIVNKINSLEPEMEKLTDHELKEKTEYFKKQLTEGKTLDDILPEAFAVVREASKRALGMRHFDVQLIGGIILHQGRIAEMKTAADFAQPLFYGLSSQLQNYLLHNLMVHHQRASFLPGSYFNKSPRARIFFSILPAEQFPHLQCLTVNK